MASSSEAGPSQLTRNDDEKPTHKQEQLDAVGEVLIKETEWFAQKWLNQDGSPNENAKFVVGAFCDIAAKTHREMNIEDRDPMFSACSQRDFFKEEVNRNVRLLELVGLFPQASDRQIVSDIVAVYVKNGRDKQ